MLGFGGGRLLVNAGLDEVEEVERQTHADEEAGIVVSSQMVSKQTNRCPKVGRDRKHRQDEDKSGSNDGP